MRVANSAPRIVSAVGLPADPAAGGDPNPELGVDAPSASPEPLSGLGNWDRLRLLSLVNTNRVLECTECSTDAVGVPEDDPAPGVPGPGRAMFMNDRDRFRVG